MLGVPSLYHAVQYRRELSQISFGLERGSRFRRVLDSVAGYMPKRGYSSLLLSIEAIILNWHVPAGKCNR